MDRPNIKNSFPMRVSETLVGERKSAQHNEENATPDERFHADCAGG
jgi:hypothetical protein